MLEGETLILAIPQLSELPLLIMLVVIGIFALALRYNTMPLVTFTIGLTVSETVTATLAVLTFPLTSVTVKVTLFEPTLLQLKLVLLNDIVEIPQLSEVPLSTFTTEIVAEPDAFK